MANYVSITSPKKKKTAALLCLFFGWCGAHQFYVGKIGTGFLYLFTGGCFMKCWWSDLGKIIMGKFKDNRGTYLVE